MKIGIYPGSFNPPTVAHLAVSRAAYEQRELDQVVWSISTQALAKESVQHPIMSHRLGVLHEIAAHHDWLDIQVTELQLLADIAEGFDTLIMGADKWDQIQDIGWYGSESARTEAFARLPSVAVAPRPPITVPTELLLTVDPAHGLVSSTAARAGATHLMLPSAQQFAEQSGAWIDDNRYLDFLSEAK